MTPTIGRTVHYHEPALYGPKPFTAFIVDVISETAVNLSVLTHDGHSILGKQSVEFWSPVRVQIGSAQVGGEPQAPKSWWTWPPRA